MADGFAVNYYSVTRQTVDIIGLIKKNEIDVKESGFKTISLEYGTEELHKKIMRLV